MTTMLFPLGQGVNMTSAAAALLPELMPAVTPEELIRRHVTGDFGTAGQYADIKPTITPQEWSEGVFATSEDGKLNVIAIERKEGRVCSYYTLGEHTVWVITELGPYGYTTVLLPSDY